MNLIFGMKGIYLMLLDSLVKIVVERCTRNTPKVPTVWNINYQIIKNNNTTTQKKASGCFSPMLFLGYTPFNRRLNGDFSGYEAHSIYHSLSVYVREGSRRLPNKEL